MKRTQRRPFCFKAEYFQDMPGEAQNKLLFDWWCDDGDRSELLRVLNGRPLGFHSRALRQDDPSPPINLPAPQGFGKTWILCAPEHIDQVLRNENAQFSNIPYATLGGGGFLLAQDPSADDPRHAQQVAFVKAALDPLGNATEALGDLAARAVSQAALTALASSEVDLAHFAEQAGLRYFGLLFGFGFQDHPLLECASRAAYRALQYVAVGQHFATEPLTVPLARQAVGALVARTSELANDYTRLAASPRRFGTPAARSWPTGVQPWSELGLRCLGKPLLASIDAIDSPLSGRDRAIVCAMLVAGTVGNIQSAACLLVHDLLRSPADELAAVRDMTVTELAAELGRRLCRLRPLPVLPRRALADVRFGNCTIQAGDDVLLALEAGALPFDCQRATACPHVWGRASAGSAVHACLGKAIASPLIVAIVRHTLGLHGLTRALDPLTGEALDPDRLWGFACTSFPLRHDRQRRRIQTNLIVSFRVKAPIAQHAGRLRGLIAAAAPRIDDVLTNFEGVHFAWFEFADDDTRLVLRTIYDGPFEAYIRHFALRAGDLFDGLFEFLEDAPPRPIDEHPDDFVEAIRRSDRAPFAGYLYTAYPGVTVAQIGQRTDSR